MVKKIILTTALVVSIYADSCWTSVEMSKFALAEFDGKAIFSIKDTVTCEPISGAEFFIGSSAFKADRDGLVTVPLPPEELDRELPITIKKAGYIESKENIMVYAGSYWNNRFLMSKALPIHSARFALSWSDKPADLDLHLKANSYHISFRKTKNIANTVKLDRDAMRGYGPETITVDKLDKNDNYRVIAYRFSSVGTIDEKTQVRVYLNNKLDRVVRLKTTTARCVEVATITDNKINYELKELKDIECK